MPSLACIADDYTGASELASSLQRVGLKTVLRFGPPQPGEECPPCDAVVVALKSRTLPAQEAVDLTRAVHTWVREQGATQVFFKYCSTFDSTAAGNIGPVATALAEQAKAEAVVFCPATPEQGRTIYKGHLFVYSTLLSHSHMRHHPLTPMRESNIITLLSKQVNQDVGLLALQTIREGSTATQNRMKDLLTQNTPYIVADATNDEDLAILAEACRHHQVVTGAVGLARALGRLHVHTDNQSPFELPSHPGRTAVLAGSCSARTLEQIAHMKQRYPSLKIDADAVAQNRDVLEHATLWAQDNLASGPALIYSSATPEELQRLRTEYPGQDVAGALEKILGDLANRLVDLGIRRIVVAGGETTGAVLGALGVDSVEVGPELDAGVPWIVSRSDPKLTILPKSGNFGEADLFVRAVEAA